MVGEQQMWDKEVEDNKEAWSHFRSVCVNLAEQGLELKKLEKELVEELNRLVAERNVTNEVTPLKSLPPSQSLCLPSSVCGLHT